VFVPKGITIQEEDDKHHPTPNKAVDAGWKDEKIERAPSDLTESKFFRQRANFQSAKHLLKSLTTSNQIHAKDELN
jgi:hypothetical protein